MVLCGATASVYTEMSLMYPSHLQRQLEDLDDASAELMLSDGEVVRILTGDSFLHVDKDDADEKLTQLTDEARAQLSEHQSALASVKGKMAELKVVLYGKFGNSINLEE
eukprot:jgi/Chrzof1/1312/Cz10g02190.t1